MNRKFKERFEMELTKAKDSLDKPRGKKTYEKVIERVGRAIPENVDKNSGKYFLRTNCLKYVASAK